MGIVGKSLRLVALFFLLLVGWMAIGALHLSAISYKVPVMPLGDGRVLTGSWDQGFVLARGTWTIDGEKHAFPLNMSEINCVKARNVCNAAEARVSDDWLEAAHEEYNITKWDNSTLEFVSDATCVSYVYVINRSTEKLTGRRIAKATSDPICQSVVLSPELRLSLVNGLDVVNKLRSEHSPTIFSTVLATVWAAFILGWIWLVIRRRPNQGPGSDPRALPRQIG
jgi:hypothetical protein